MKLKLHLLILPGIFLLSGCITSEDPFYEDADIKNDDRLVGTYDDANGTSSFDIYRDSGFQHDGKFWVTVRDKPACSMKFGAVLFQVGTNSFLDLVPIIEACDHLAANPPSLVEIMQSLTLKPMHMVVRAEISTNGLRLGLPDDRTLRGMDARFPEYFLPAKSFPFPRMIPSTGRQREFLARFGGDTNIFRMGKAIMPKNNQDPVTPRRTGPGTPSGP